MDSSRSRKLRTLRKRRMESLAYRVSVERSQMILGLVASGWDQQSAAEMADTILRAELGVFS